MICIFYVLILKIKVTSKQDKLLIIILDVFNNFHYLNMPGILKDQITFTSKLPFRLDTNITII